MSSNDNGKLIATAAVAAVAGAAAAVVAMNMMQGSALSGGSPKPSTSSSSRNMVESSGDGNRPHRPSYIYEDESTGKGDTLLLPHNHEEKMRRRIAARVAVEEDNSMPRRSVTVRVPATSANVGPGYDCIGMAVDLWSEVTVELADKFEIVAEGEGAAQMPKDETNYMVIGVKAAYDAANKPMPTLKYHVVNRIPYARGLGSSSAAIVSGIIAGLVLAGHRLPCWGSEALLQIAAGIEGHPDNVAPAIYGGIQVGIHNGTRWMSERAPTPPGLQTVMFIPDFVGKTATARGVLKDTVTREEAAFNLGRAAFLVHALCTGNLDNLKFGVQDKLHQPQRGRSLYKYLFPMIEAAEKAGACCAYLSGAGPTVMALTSGASGDIFAQREKERTDIAVAKAMLDVAKQFNIKGQLLVTAAVTEGARVVRVDPPFSSQESGIVYRDNI